MTQGIKQILVKLSGFWEKHKIVLYFTAFKLAYRLYDRLLPVGRGIVVESDSSTNKYNYTRDAPANGKVIPKSADCSTENFHSREVQMDTFDHSPCEDSKEEVVKHYGDDITCKL